jgi:nucleotide-binding universal stress UspA family protein
VFSNILVGVDGRQGGRDAMALAEQLAAPGGRITPEHVDGDSVGHALHELAVRGQYDLLVVGACHRGAITRHIAGDHTIQSVRGATCAVAVAPHGYAAASDISRVGVAWDGSPEAVQALEAAHEMAARTGATIEPVFVLPRQSLPYGQPIRHRFSDVAQQLTLEDLARLDRIDDLDGQVRYGSPGEQLADFSEDVDLLVVGSRNSGPLGRLLTGSTSSYLARRARCPLLVFPRAATEC